MLLITFSLHPSIHLCNKPFESDQVNYQIIFGYVSSCLSLLQNLYYKKSELLSSDKPILSLIIANPRTIFKQPQLGSPWTDFKNSKAWGSARISSLTFAFRPKLSDEAVSGKMRKIGTFYHRQFCATVGPLEICPLQQPFPQHFVQQTHNHCWIFCQFLFSSFK